MSKVFSNLSKAYTKESYRNANIANCKSLIASSHIAIILVY